MSKAKIYYHDIGDYLNREEKLGIVKKFGSITNIPLKTLEPNEHGDWISQRNDVFDTFIQLEPDKKFNSNSYSFFTLNSMGIGSSRDAWVYNSSKSKVEKNMKLMVDFFNKQVSDFLIAKKNNPNIDINEFIETDTKKISWSSSLIPNLVRGNKADFQPYNIKISYYRPFNKQFVYLGEKMIHRRGQFDKIFFGNQNNLIISISFTNIGLAVLISDLIADIHFNGDTQCFPLYYYEERQKKDANIFDVGSDKEYIRRDGVSDFILDRAKKQYGKNITKEDIFYYVYGFLHSPEYRKTFANDLKKMLPRLPLVDDVRDFWAFGNAGRKLAELHINYESVPPAPGVIVLYNTIPRETINKALQTKELQDIDYRVEKMRYPKKGQTDTIIYNSQITIENIPAKAYEYVVNGKSAIDWIMERYQVTVHKESGIKNDPNDWAIETGKPKYILDLLLSIINVSIQTVDIVNSLPKLKFE